MSGHTNGIQRMIQRFWDKDVENTDLQNPIYSQGKEYKPDTSITNKSEDVSSGSEDDDKDSKSIDNPFDEIRNYFQSLSFISEAQKKLENIASTPWPVEFIDDIHSKLWFTYRTQFKPLSRDVDGPSPLSLKNLLRGQTNELNNDYFTTDCGWGCMIRTSQTLLANALLKLKLDSEWRFVEGSENLIHDEIVKWFVDAPDYPFSIHKMVEKGRLLSGKKAGEWFGPSAAARSIQSLASEFDCGLSVYIGSDAGDIYEQDLFKVFKSKGEFKPTLILLGVRLGVENINSIYWNSLKDLLGSVESCGISGGRPSSSHYFFGHQGDYLFYLDPHYPQPCLEFDDQIKSINSVKSVHTKKIRKIHISEVDPSMLVGILIRTEDEWYNWKSKIQDPESKNTIIHISPDNMHSEMLNRKPSFVVYNEDGDDFVDVGYEDLIEEDIDDGDGNQKNDLEESHRTEEEYEIPEANEEVDTSIISMPESGGPQIDSVPADADINDTSFEHYTGEIKDDYENIENDGTIYSEIDDSNTVEVESIHQEEPYVVDESDIPEPTE